jgi:tetratricopeptide (TPR) repeat protein
MRFLFHTLGCTLPPAFVLFLLVDTAVNPNVPRFGTTLNGPGPNGSLSLDESRELLALSRKLVAEGKDEEALKPALKLYAAYPRNHIYTQTLAQIYQRLGRLKEETQYWEKFLQDAPLPIEACPDIGHAYWKQRLHRKALDAYERCLTFEPDNIDSIFALAHARELNGETAKAAALYRKGLVTTPMSLDTRIGLARVEMRLGQTAAAKKRIDAVLRERPENTDALLVAGMIAWDQGNLAEARRYLLKGSALSPGYADYQTVLGRINREAAHRSAPAGPSQ